MGKVANRVGKEYNDFCIISGEPEIAENVWIGYFCVIDGTGGLKIANNVTIASGAHIYTHDAIKKRLQRLEADHENYSHIDRAPVEIGENVFIGANAVILKGVKIGKNVVVGAGAVVTKDIPDNSIAVGNPAKVVKDIDPETLR